MYKFNKKLELISFSEKRLVYYDEGGPQISESAEGESKKKFEGTSGLDEVQSDENHKLARKFEEDFGSRMKDGKLTILHTRNKIDYTYTFEDNGDGTIAITQINESEVEEKGSSEPRSATVSYLRLYADKVFSMPGVGKILLEEKGREEEQNTSQVEIEAGVMIPKFIETSGESYLHESEMGGELTGRYKLSEPSNLTPYIALTGSLVGSRGSRQYMPRAKAFTYTGTVLLWSDTRVYSADIRAGAEVGLPIGDYVSFAGGAGVSGKIEYISKGDTYLGPQSVPVIFVEERNVEFKPGAFITARGQVNIIPGRWHIYGRGEFTTEGDARFFAGTGIGF